MGLDSISNEGSGTMGVFLSLSLVSPGEDDDGFDLTGGGVGSGSFTSGVSLISSDPSELLGLLASGGPDGSYDRQTTNQITYIVYCRGNMCTEGQCIVHNIEVIVIHVP